MNLEFDADEEHLLSQAARIFADIAPLSAIPERRTTYWSLLVNAGWSELGSHVETGALPLGLAAGIFRQAGRQLLVEQFVSSSYLLPALISHITDDGARDRASTALRINPGVLIGDGRDGAIPIVNTKADEGFCFGAEGTVDAYRVIRTQDEYKLSRCGTSPESVEFVPSSGLSMACVRVTNSADAWEDFDLDIGDTDLSRIATSAVLLHSAGLVGCAEQMLEVTIQHAKTRHQFGVPIGSFQAVKHALADVATANTVAWNAILTATAAGADREMAPLVARYLAAEAVLGSARAGAQFHGGIGFTSELNVHYFLRTALEGAQRFGSHDDTAAALCRLVVARAC